MDRTLLWPATWTVSNQTTKSSLKQKCVDKINFIEDAIKQHKKIHTKTEDTLRKLDEPCENLLTDLSCRKLHGQSQWLFLFESQVTFSCLKYASSNLATQHIRITAYISDQRCGTSVFCGKTWTISFWNQLMGLQHYRNKNPITMTSHG